MSPSLPLLSVPINVCKCWFLVYLPFPLDLLNVYKCWFPVYLCQSLFVCGFLRSCYRVSRPVRYRAFCGREGGPGAGGLPRRIALLHRPWPLPGPQTCCVLRLLLAINTKTVGVFLLVIIGGVDQGTPWFHSQRMRAAHLGTMARVLFSVLDVGSSTSAPRDGGGWLEFGIQAYRVSMRWVHRYHGEGPEGSRPRPVGRPRTRDVYNPYYDARAQHPGVRSPRGDARARWFSRFVPSPSPPKGSSL